MLIIKITPLGVTVMVEVPTGIEPVYAVLQTAA